MEGRSGCRIPRRVRHGETILRHPAERPRQPLRLHAHRRRRLEKTVSQGCLGQFRCLERPERQGRPEGALWSLPLQEHLRRMPSQGLRLLWGLHGPRPRMHPRKRGTKRLLLPETKTDAPQR